ncbi:MAG: alkaline phosphatase PhoX [Pseudomonadota bacterium]
MNKFVTAAVATALAAASGIAAAHGHHADIDFGKQVDALARIEALPLFGIATPLRESSSVSLTMAQAEANPAALATAAPGLKVRVVSAAANLGANIDMMALWPNDTAPTHIIACNEQGSGNVGVQRINLATGAASDIISSGLTSCDPVEITPWGTIIIGEENGTNGRVFEILDPIGTTGVTVTGSGSATATSNPTHVQLLGALGQLAFEGISVLPNGVVYYQDENRPSSTSAGGGYFKFIPTNLWTGGAPITTLANSPLVSGHIYGLRIGRNSGNTDTGLANHVGRGVWVDVGTSDNALLLNLRAALTTFKLSAGYRPEDQDIDKGALADGQVRVCGTNTGQDVPESEANGDNSFGETFCITDGTLAQAAANTAVPEYQLLISHFLDFGMPDNIAYQPGSGNWLINEDGEGALYTPARNNDIWACLDDGDDANQLSDACVKVITLNDLTAESTGGVFNATGKEYYFSVQHNITGHGVILKVTGWR